MSPRDKYDRHDSSDDDSDHDFDEEYFTQTYKPLSNLPTPPLSSKNSSAAQSPTVEVDDGEYLQPAFLGSAIHLVNLFPPAASLAIPSIPLVQAILSRAKLPMHTVALAVCIMDSLNSKFCRQWRLSCPLLSTGSGTTGPPRRLEPDQHQHRHQYHHKRHTIGPLDAATPEQEQQPLHIDSVPPELIILSALIIAAKFTEDSQEPTRWYASAWGRQLWSCAQINTTERCIMENLEYRIMPLAAPEILEDALSDMARAVGAAASASASASHGAQAPRSAAVKSHPGFVGGGRDDAVHLRSKSCGKPTTAVSGLGLQLTRTESPCLDH